jgi:hypothetical protein
MAFDPASLAFPSILGCQAIRCHTSGGLCSVINPDEQYNTDPSADARWKEVLRGLAGGLTFAGDMSGTCVNRRLEKKSSKNVESAYVQSGLTRTRCRQDAGADRRWTSPSETR